MKTLPAYKEVFDIATGDIVTTSYKSGPYYIKNISGPYTWCENWHCLTIWPWPTVSLKLTYTDPSKTTSAYINDIHREKDRWFSTNRDEIFIRKPRVASARQITMDSYPPTPDPYPFQANINYYAGDRKIWHCPACKTDFNTQLHHKTNRPNCPHCDTRRLPILIIAIGNGQPGNACIRSINL